MDATTKFIRSYANPTLAQDDQWITVKPNGPNKTGRPALIGPGGEIKAGMGGKFTGTKIKDLKKTISKQKKQASKQNAEQAPKTKTVSQPEAKEKTKKEAAKQPTGLVGATMPWQSSQTAESEGNKKYSNKPQEILSQHGINPPAGLNIKPDSLTNATVVKNNLNKIGQSFGASSVSLNAKPGEPGWLQERVNGAFNPNSKEIVLSTDITNGIHKAMRDVQKEIKNGGAGPVDISNGPKTLLHESLHASRDKIDKYGIVSGGIVEYMKQRAVYSGLDEAITEHLAGTLAPAYFGNALGGKVKLTAKPTAYPRQRKALESFFSENKMKIKDHTGFLMDVFSNTSWPKAKDRFVGLAVQSGANRESAEKSWYKMLAEGKL